MAMYVCWLNSGSHKNLECFIKMTRQIQGLGVNRITPWKRVGAVYKAQGVESNRKGKKCSPSDAYQNGIAIRLSM